MFLPGLLSFTSHAMGHAEIKMLDSWKLGTNLFCLLIAESGSGKSGAMKIFSQEISTIQKEEIAAYDQQRQSSKDPSPNKRLKTENSNTLFHKKKRIIGQVIVRNDSVYKLIPSLSR